MSGYTTDKDLGRERILKGLESLKKSFVTIGVHASEPDYENGKSVAYVATQNEFGNETVPERSFLRSTFDEKKIVWNEKTRHLLKQVIIGNLTIEKALRILGFEMATEVQNKIETLRIPPNAPSTIAGKPSVGDNPLIRSRKLLRSIGFQVSVVGGLSQTKREGEVKHGGLK